MLYSFWLRDKTTKTLIDGIINFYDDSGMLVGNTAVPAGGMAEPVDVTGTRLVASAPGYQDFTQQTYSLPPEGTAVIINMTKLASGSPNLLLYGLAALAGLFLINKYAGKNH